MTEFLIAAGAGTVLVALIMVWPLVTGAARGRGRDAADAALYRDQLDELDRDIARGTITEAEAEGARAEIARRLIASTKRAESAGTLAPAPPQVSRMIAAIAVVAAPALAALLYVQVGSPGAEDQPLAERRSTARADMPPQAVAERLAEGRRPPPPALEPEYAQMLERLKKIVADQPMDLRGQRLLARNLAASGQWVEARQAYDRLLQILGGNATAEDHANHAEAMIFATAGYVSPEAANALEKALRLDPSLTQARYYAGFALRQGGRIQDAVALWQALLAEDRAAADPRGADWQQALVSVIRETTGQGAPGPTADDVRNAEEMTPEDRQAMIATMVAGLEERLTSDGGEPEEWVRLIRSYTALGKTSDARRIYRLSQERLSEQTARAFVREQALIMGLEIE